MTEEKKTMEVDVEQFNQQYAQLQKAVEENKTLKEGTKELEARLAALEAGARHSKGGGSSEQDVQRMLVDVDWKRMGTTKERWTEKYEEKPFEAINDLVNYKLEVGGEVLTSSIMQNVKIDEQHTKDLRELANAYPEAFKNPSAARLEFNGSDRLGKMFLDELFGSSSKRYVGDMDGVKLLKMSVEEKYKNIYGDLPEPKAKKKSDDFDGAGPSVGGGARQKREGTVELGEEEKANAEKLIKQGTFKDINEYVKYRDMRTIE